MTRASAIDEFNKNRKIIIREVPPVTYDDVKSFMGKFAVSNIAISRKLRHAIVELKHGKDAEPALEYLRDKKLLDTEVRSLLFRQDHLMCLEGLPQSWDSEELRTFASPHGGVEKCFVMLDDEGMSLGYGFVEFVHNKELSDIARRNIDRSLLPSGHVVRCRFVNDHVTRFEQLKSCCIIVTNLPLEVGLEKFYMLLLHFGSGTIRPIKYQVGVATMMGKFGAAEFESHDFARIMRRKINGNLYPIGETVKSKGNHPETELGASFCTPGESIDDIMKDMSSVTPSSNQVKQFATSQSGPDQTNSCPSKIRQLVHPDILDKLKNSSAVNEFVSLLEQMVSINKDISHHLSNTDFQRTVLTTMLALKNSNSNINDNNIKNNLRPTKGLFQNRNARSSNDLEMVPSCSSMGQSSFANHRRTTSPLDGLLTGQTSFDFLTPEDFHHKEPFYSKHIQSLSYKATEFTTSQKPLPSLHGHPTSLVEANREADEPCPGFNRDFSPIRSLLNNNVRLPLPASSFANDGPSNLQLSAKLPELCVPLMNPPSHCASSDHNYMTNPHSSIQYGNLAPSNSSQNHLSDCNLRHAGQWNHIGQPNHSSSQSMLSQPILNNLVSVFFDKKERVKTPPGFELQINNTGVNKRKKWRPKVVEQCWTDLENKDIAMPNHRQASSPIKYNVSSPKKRKALSENNIRNMNSNVSLVVGENKMEGRPFSHPGGFNLTTESRPMFPTGLPDPVADSTYVGQHQQGLGGEYVDSLLRKRKFREALDAQFKRCQ